MSKPVQGQQETESFAKLKERLKDEMQDNKKVQAELREQHPRYFISSQNGQISQ